MARKGRPLKAGKLPHSELKRLLRKYAPGGPGVAVGPSIGIDAAAIEFCPGKYLLAKTDPITFLAEDIGFYSIAINSNDIAVMGGSPRWFLATILLPEGSCARDAERIFSQIRRACSPLGVSLCGGHTEVTHGIDRPIVVGQMLGEVARKGLVTAAGARPGDDIILTKGVAIEAASVLARLKEKELQKSFSGAFIKRCKDLIKRPGLSVLEDARALVAAGRVHAMHDPTEGGLLMGLYELAEASSCGLLIERSRIHILPEAGRLCDYFGLDPLGSIASGALLAAVDGRDTPRMLKGLEKSGIRATVIGKAVERREGIKMTADGKKRAMRVPERDEVTKIF